MANHQQHEHQILTQLEAGGPVTQRRLSKELGIALGLTNVLVRQLVSKGWVRMRRIKRSRIRYLITPAGIAAKAKLTKTYLRDSLVFYRTSRDRIRQRLAVLSSELTAADSSGRPGIVFYGAGELAEIAYVCLQETDFELLGVVDPLSPETFLRMPIHPPAVLDGMSIEGRPFSKLVVLLLDDEVDTVKATLNAQRVPPDCVFWL